MVRLVCAFPRGVGVVIPARDEQDRLAACLAAVATAATRVLSPVWLCIVLDRCRDASMAVARSSLAEHGDAFGYTAVLQVEHGSVGRGRSAGMTRLLQASAESGRELDWLATTDADSTVPPRWFVAQLAHRARGAEVVAGTIAVSDWSGRSAELRQRAVADYERDGMRHVHGANLSFTADAYACCGGFAALPTGEDVDLVDRLRDCGHPIAWATDLQVQTSARRAGRAPDGFAAYLAELERDCLGGSALEGLGA